MCLARSPKTQKKKTAPGLKTGPEGPHRANASTRTRRAATRAPAPHKHKRGREGTDANPAHTHTQGTGKRELATIRENSRTRTMRRRTATYRLAESYCHGRSRTDTGCQTRSAVSWRRPEGGIHLGNGRLEFRRNPQTKTRRTPSRTSPPRHAHHHVRRADKLRRTRLSWAWRCPRKCSPCS